MKKGLEQISRRNALKGLAGLAGILFLPECAEATEVFPFENSFTRNGVRIETNGEGYLNYNYGRLVDDSENPNVSLGSARDNYKVCVFVPEGRNISIELPKNNQYGGIDTRYGRFAMTVHGPGSAEIIKRDNNLVPLVNVKGKFTIKAGKYVELDAWDDYADGNAIDETGVSINSGGDFRSQTPAFQIDAHDKFGRKIGNPGSPKNYFVDFHGKADGGFCIPIKEGNKSIIIYMVNIGDYTGIYYPTQSFAHLKNKEKFWMNTDFSTQLKLRNASYRELERFVR